MNPIFQAAIGSILRALLGGVTAWFVQRGIWSQDAANEYLAASVTGLVTLILILWSKYKDRLKFLTALEAKPGTPEEKIDKLISQGLGAKVFSVLLVVTFAGVSTVGCGANVKPILVKSNTAVYEAVKAIHETATVLGTSGVTTVAQELQIQQAILPVSVLGEKITRVIVAWKSGPTPPEIRALVAELGALLTEVGRILPIDDAAKAALVEKIALAQQAILVLLTLMGVVS